MSIFAGSRYRLLEPIQVEDSEGAVNSYHRLRKTTSEAPVGSKRYTTQSGDSFETLAFQRYGDSNKWYILADANPHIFWPLDLVSGQEIVIPPKSYAELN